MTNRPKRSMSEGMKALIATAIGAGLVCLALWPFAVRAETYSGPYGASVVRVIDADTLELAVDVWPGQVVTVAVRVLGIDTPEVRRPDCEAERALGRRASALVRGLAPPASRVALLDVQEGKYAGRVVGTIAVDGESLADALIEAQLARPYNGRGPRPEWCADE